MTSKDDPTELSRDVAEAVVNLAACLSTDVQVDALNVLAPLFMAAGGLRRVMDEMAQAAISVDEEAAAALRHAGEHFSQAKADVAAAIAHLPKQAPPGTVYGKPRNVTD